MEINKKLYESAGWIGPVVPQDFLDKLKTDREAFKLAHEILENPLKFGAENIKSAARFINGSIRNIPGSVVLLPRKVYLEQNKEKPHILDVYRLSAYHSFYDPAILTQFGHEWLGIYPKDKTHFGLDDITSLEEKCKCESRSSSVIAIRPDASVSFSQDIFKDYVLRFGVCLDNYNMKRSIGLGRNLERDLPSIRDRLAFLMEYSFGNMYIGVINGSQIFDFTQSEVPKHHKFMASVTETPEKLTVLNKGLDDCPLFLIKPESREQ